MQPGVEADSVSITIGIDEKLTQISPSPSECCIFRVHKQLRGVNEKAYEPETVAIGPYHRGKHSLQMMEEHKLRYLKLLLKRKNESSADKYVTAIASLEQEARRCYAEPISLSPDEMIEMLILDGCFIIELVWNFEIACLRDKNDPIFKMDQIDNSLQRDLMLFENQLPFFILYELFDLIEIPNNHNKLIRLALCFFSDLLPDRGHSDLGKNDSIFQMDWIVSSLQRDLMLFENQLPFFILRKLFDMIEVPNQHNRLIYLALCFFRDLLPGPGYRERIDGNSHFNIRHLLGLIHNNWLPSFAGIVPNGDGSNKKGNWRFIPNTIELQEAGVKLVKIEGASLFDIKFEYGVMKIPPLTIEDRTESFFRNLTAYEQYCPDNQLTYITDYVGFMDCLIDSPKDVEILSRRGIIDNWLGDDEVVSTIFNKFSDAVTGPTSHFQYADIVNRVNIHCGKRRNRWMAMLNRNYLNSPWAFISILAALVLLLLTSTQTVFTVFPRK
ncbi:UPF0481 protein At3g47200-like [Camellia sinensis]|uniref:UPF0481 protein At3g47200-like n=1 Tax=Camellia sinensis TaxID=4442 RepID=UPI001035F787|nr:UPF0481 protein At3g47200-like [Camellia sinensis]